MQEVEWFALLQKHRSLFDTSLINHYAVSIDRRQSFCLSSVFHKDVWQKAKAESVRTLMKVGISECGVNHKAEFPLTLNGFAGMENGQKGT